MAGLLQVDDTGFETEIERHDGLAMVDFWAAWCGPCQMIASAVEQIADEYDGRVKVAKLDVDASPQTTVRFNVRSIPAVLFFKNGDHVDTVIGAVPKAHLVDKIEQHLE